MVPADFTFNSVMLLGAVVLIAAIVSARIGARVGLPSLLLFLGALAIVVLLCLRSAAQYFAAHRARRA